MSDDNGFENRLRRALVRFDMPGPGSGVLVQWGGHSTVVTAGHVLLPPKGEIAVEDPTFAFDDNFSNQTPRDDWRCGGFKGERDFAYWRVPEKAVSQLSDRVLAVGVGLPGPGTPLWVAGYPTSSGREPEIVRTTMRHCARPHPEYVAEASASDALAEALHIDWNQRAHATALSGGAVCVDTNGSPVVVGIAIFQDCPQQRLRCPGCPNHCIVVLPVDRWRTSGRP